MQLVCIRFEAGGNLKTPVSSGNRGVENMITYKNPKIQTSRHHRGSSRGHCSPGREKTKGEWNSAAHDRNGPSQPNPPSVQK